ncbi:MAG: polysaccharide deacetylase family protein [Candidatus Melainabacteria bacterium]|nr:polysaccharide deacetylase family protein [Candidatus Melainabacteria bacterium]
MSRAEERQKKSNGTFSELLSDLHMEGLTGLAKLLLPEGLWKGQNHHVENQALADDSAAGGSREIHLTFDDGPNPATTPYLLEMFEEECVKATFFVIGNQVEKHEDLLLAVSKHGHSIGNHTYSHVFLPILSRQKMEKEILTTNQRITDVTGQQPKLFRPPFGIVDKKAHLLLQEQGMKTVYWSAFSEDWRQIGEDSVVERLSRYAVPGGIMIMHELAPTGDQTIGAARTLIRKLKERNYKFSAIA